MKTLWTRWTTWWRSQPLRQQLLVLGAIVVLGFGAIDMLVVSPADKAQRPLRNQIATLTEQDHKRQQQIKEQAAEQQRLRAEETALRARLAAADNTLTQARAGLTGPEALRRRIRELSADGSVQLVSLSTLPAEPVSLAASATSAGPRVRAEGAGLLYRMPVTATVEGPYAALREHLAKLEAADAGLTWQSLSLDNAAWPKVRMELKLMLISDRPQWRAP